MTACQGSGLVIALQLLQHISWSSLTGSQTGMHLDISACPDESLAAECGMPVRHAVFPAGYYFRGEKRLHTTYL